MATANKPSDAAEAALSAIEEALAESIGQGLAAPNGTTQPNAALSSDASDGLDALARANASKPTRRPRGDSEMDRGFPPSSNEGDVVLPGRPANDDSREIGEILQTLQSTTSMRAYYGHRFQVWAGWVLPAIGPAKNWAGA